MGAPFAMLIAAALAGQATPAPVAPATPACAVEVAADALPAEYKGWAAMQGVTAGRNMGMPATLALGRSARATLAPSAEVSFPAAPARAPDAGTSSGVFAFDVTAAGTYRVALGAAAWVDVVAGSRMVGSVAHGHGPDCSGVRKYVDFKLQPGRYLLQVAGNKAPTLALMVTRLG